MHDFITIFAYLIIATIAFALPVTITLLSLFTEAIQQVKKQAEEKERILRIIIKSLTAGDNFHSHELKSRTKLLEKSEKQTKRKLNLLSPKRQLLFLGLTLFFSLAFIFCDMVLRDNKWKWQSHVSSIFFIACSITLFGIAIFRMKKITWALIGSKVEFSQQFEKVNPTGFAGEQVIIT
jgi:hypothetical protein